MSVDVSESLAKLRMYQVGLGILLAFVTERCAHCGWYIVASWPGGICRALEPDQRSWIELLYAPDQVCNVKAGQNAQLWNGRSDPVRASAAAFRKWVISGIPAVACSVRNGLTDDVVAGGDPWPGPGRSCPHRRGRPADVPVARRRGRCPAGLGAVRGCPARGGTGPTAGAVRRMSGMAAGPAWSLFRSAVSGLDQNSPGSARQSGCLKYSMADSIARSTDAPCNVAAH